MAKDQVENRVQVCLGAIQLQTAPGDTLELNVVRGTGDRTTHVILGESGQPRRGSLSSLTPAGTTYLIFCYD